MIFSVVYFVHGNMGFVDIDKFFPEIDGNFTQVIWAHAVNNASYLSETLANSKFFRYTIVFFK